ncbi:MAG: hypothetical protein A2381_10525 [Bdellovibrionales bacterium RIFOXYB1_FULL_37_110]|nr:MAG: hypothetical protein A2417_05595 [Bdellovibrionales bacterium RIFOXYC1_FULL_37_79]OFZ61198.1 MAG: hypothetical protein A2381_10525 [Bdellovibrionales bacterium RIFOXYB1_FULL_37_110]OFZ65526.1 MAG: hypothetical protein A2577_01945 [Bdellovibrionales bacterium RIFOXYD1_FULL_36_51]
MYLNISLFNQAGKEIQKVQVDEKFNLTNFLNTHHYFIEDIDLKKFIRDINQAWNKNIKSFLFIDDSPELIEYFTDEAHAQGHYAEGFVTSDDGYERYVANPEAFDIVVLDYRMPGIDGGRVAQAFMELNQNVRLVLLTGDESLRPETINKIPIIYKPSRLKDIIEAASIYNYQSNFSKGKR